MLHHRLSLPSGDVLIHCGDFSNEGTEEECADFCRWASQQPFRHKLLVCGNHDLTCDESWYQEHWQAWHESFQSPERVAAMLEEAGITVLAGSGRALRIAGVCFYGSPWQPRQPKVRRPMAFGLRRGAELKEEWAKIPTGIDVLLTHTPPANILDIADHTGRQGQSIGCEELAKAVSQRTDVAVHVFGHVHGSYGIHRSKKTFFINAASAATRRGEGAGDLSFGLANSDGENGTRLIVASHETVDVDSETVCEHGLQGQEAVALVRSGVGLELDKLTERKTSQKLSSSLLQLSACSFLSFKHSLAAMPSNFPDVVDFDDDGWDQLSHMSLLPSANSLNTGFSGGTSAVRLQGRLLSFEIDEYLIRQAVHFEAGFVSKQEQDSAKIKYEQLLELLEKAMDDNDVICALDETFRLDLLNVESSLVPLLLQNPADCPLLQHCAKQGWASAVKWLVEHGFRDGLGYRCKHQMSVLHLVAWEGQTNVLAGLGCVEQLCDIPNAFGELPELSGFIRSQQLALETGGDVTALQQACLDVALACRRVRTKMPCCSCRAFVEEANAQLPSASSLSEVLLPVGVEAQAIQRHLQGPLLCSDFVSRYVDLPSAPLLPLCPRFQGQCPHDLQLQVLPRVLEILVTNVNLERLVLEYCCLGAGSATPLKHFFDSLPHRRGIVFSLSGDRGNILDCELFRTSMFDRPILILLSAHGSLCFSILNWKGPCSCNILQQVSAAFSSFYSWMSRHWHL
ncbi:Mpped1 [Symbiodinium necroappetens]|uniref:Mpped1 protein n=1 Tax=Symbiodinium necroappetens TaxID=1628268 RepID=A0A812P8H8_9DINO|nr:Mpped1 [Symbiodinium necroappetens]